MLDFALDARLGFVLHHHKGVAAAQDAFVQFGLARAVATHGIEVHARLDHLGQQDGGVALVGGDRGHDVAAAHGLLHRCAAHDLQVRQVQARQVAFEFCAGSGVCVEQAQLADALQVIESQRLELALRAIADQRHGAAVLPGQVARGQHRHGGGAQCGGQREFGHQQRVAGVHIGQYTKGRDGEQALGRVLGVAVDILEAVQVPVAGGHEFDHSDGGVNGVPRRFVELLPAPVVAVHGLHQLLQKMCQPDVLHQFAYAVYAHEIHHDGLLILCMQRILRKGAAKEK